MFIRFVVGWTFTKPFWLERSFLPQTAHNLTTKRNAFLLTIPTCTALPIGFTQTTALMFVWNLRASIGSLCSIFLKNAGIRVTIANPKWVKAVKGNKDDTKDSKWIGDLFRLELVPGSFIPSKNIRILREFTRYRYKLVSMKSS